MEPWGITQIVDQVGIVRFVGLSVLKSHKLDNMMKGTLNSNVYYHDTIKRLTNYELSDFTN